MLGPKVSPTLIEQCFLIDAKKPGHGASLSFEPGLRVKQQSRLIGRDQQRHHHAVRYPLRIDDPQVVSAGQ